MLSRLLDQTMDLAVVPGFTRIGYAVRSRKWDPPWQGHPLEGKAVIITGPTAGLGKATAAGLARAGAEIHLVVRDVAKGEALVAELSELTEPRKLRLWECDMSDLDSVRSFTTAFEAAGIDLNVLIHNAGVLSSERRSTPQGHELTFATNALGPFLMTELLVPALERGAPSRVIFVSSGGMYAEGIDLDDLELDGREFEGERFYAHTKRIEVALAELFTERYAARGITAYSTHPGWAATAGVADALPTFNRVLGPLLRTPEQGSDTTVWMTWAPEVAEHPGAFWHDRRPRPKHRLPGTRESAADRERLWELMEAACGQAADSR